MHRWKLTIALTLAAAVVFAGPSALKAQEFVAPPAKAPVSADRESPLRAGREALEAGEFVEAARHLRAALWWAPQDPEVLALLVKAAAQDPEASRLWAAAWLAAAMDERGRAKQPRDLAPAFPEDPAVTELAALRAGAARDLLRWAGKLKGSSRRLTADNVRARWGLGLGKELADGSPSLQRTLAPALSEAVERSLADPGAVLSALTGKVDRLLRAGRPGEAVEVARCLQGLSSQAAFKDLKGPEPPDLLGMRSAAVRALREARAALAAQIGEPLDVDALAEMDELEAERFSEQHADFANPGVAVSPGGLYRIETCCGHQTLLGAADTVEYHHQRLVNWYGQDPFQGRQGTVRIVAEHSGLEMEGSPFWWAGGFQSGDVTTLRFAVGTIEGLGRGLTHELTHRFDGAIYPGLPSWLSEGRAVWTGAAYGSIWDEDFYGTYASSGAMQSALSKGYGGRRKLEELITGEIDDYRDNYTAGHALFVYLDAGPGTGGPLFAERLQDYLLSVGQEGRRDPLGHFVATFCDGQEGRPADFKTFAQGFGEFLSGFYWQDRKPWTSRFQAPRRPGRPPVYVFDDATWVWSRKRAEPWFGQDQAARAGDLLMRLDEPQDAARAWLWAQDIDEPDRERSLRLAEVLATERLPEAAWALRRRVRRDGDRADLEESPELKALPALREYLQALAAAAEAAQAEQPRWAAALAADHDRLREWTGGARLAMRLPGKAAGPLHPFDPPPYALGRLGWVEDGLIDYEERRVPDLWYETEGGDLHVGRARPRDSTGTLDRRAHQRHAFTASREWHRAGRYEVVARIHCTTSFVSGAMILGWTRRDRHLRANFSAGDFLYSIGSKEDVQKIERVNVSLDGLRERDGPLGGAKPRRRHDFQREKSWFELRAVVDGPEVHVYVDEALVGRYHTVDGCPIEGRVGFAMGQGAIRVQKPTVQRLDRAGVARADDGRPLPLRLDEPLPLWMETLRNRSFPGLGESDAGFLVLLLPRPPKSERADYDPQAELPRIERMLQRLARDSEADGLPQQTVLALPEDCLPALVDPLRAEARALGVAELPILAHRWARANPETGEEVEDDDPLLVFVDSQHVVRDLRLFTGLGIPDTEGLRRWLRVFAAEATAPEAAGTDEVQPGVPGDAKDGDAGDGKPPRD